MDTPFRIADSCPVMDGSHEGNRLEGNFLVADAVTADGTASVRIALWRCAACGVQLVGIGKTGPDLDGPPGTGVHVQEFTWLEEQVVLIGSREGPGVT